MPVCPRFPGRAGESDVRLHHPFVEATFGALLALETILIRRRIRLPFGLSLLAAARRS